MALEGVVPFPPEFARKYREKGYWRDKSLRDEFDAVFKKFSSRVGLIDGQTQYTYQQIDRLSDNLALNLLELGVGELPFSIHQKDFFREAREAGGEFLRQALVLPVALLAVAPRELGRERDDAGERHYVELV